MDMKETWNNYVFNEYVDKDDFGEGNRPYKAA